MYLLRGASGGPVRGKTNHFWYVLAIGHGAAAIHGARVMRVGDCDAGRGQASSSDTRCSQAAGSRRCSSLTSGFLQSSLASPTGPTPRAPSGP
eukprot:scaffold1549_cov350-Prasinococcus_capsulatus_cf.AAC.24